jgi:hypothetical protein
MWVDVPQMTWFANVKMLLWRFVDKMGDGRAFGPDAQRTRRVVFEFRDEAAKSAFEYSALCRLKERRQAIGSISPSAPACRDLTSRLIEAATSCTSCA